VQVKKKYPRSTNSHVRHNTLFSHVGEITTKFFILQSKEIRNWQFTTEYPNGQHPPGYRKYFSNKMETDHRANAALNIHTIMF
jgi:hypothetical protein